jgi:hypothetical protein
MAKAKKTHKASDRDVTIRMFCQGLGDCFLITVPQKGARPYSIVIDFGVAMGTHRADELMRQVVKKIAELTDGAVDLLVVTHEHWDHVSGFVHAAEELSPAHIAFNHVWYAWTEDANDPLVRSLRGRFKKAKLALARAFQSGSALAATDPTSAQRLVQLEGILAFLGPGADSGKDTAGAKGTLDDAMQTPRTLVNADRNPDTLKYLRPGQCHPLPGAGSGMAADVRAFVLGPPHDAAKLLRVNPSPAKPETYEKHAGDPPGLAINWAWMASAMSGAMAATELSGDPDDIANEERSRPFDSTWGISLDAAATDPFFESTYFSAGGGERGRRIDGDWLWSGAQRLALQVDSYTNNTSLVLAFELPHSKKVLLFAGDAQVGNWLSWYDQSYTTTDGRTLTAEELLANTALYKVGHHGSHNATLREKGLERMTHPDLVALLPVEAEGVARLRYGQMPLRSLMTALGERTKGRVLRLDQQWTGDAPPGTWDHIGSKASLSSETVTVGDDGKTSTRALYIEFVIADG